MSTLPDPQTDPAGYVLGGAAEVDAEASRLSLGKSDRCFHTPEDDAWLVDFYLQQAALWRGIAERHAHAPGDHICLGCSEDFPCPDLLAAVAAAKAYAEGTP